MKITKGKECEVPGLTNGELLLLLSLPFEDVLA